MTRIYITLLIVLVQSSFCLSQKWVTIAEDDARFSYNRLTDVSIDAKLFSDGEYIFYYDERGKESPAFKGSIKNGELTGHYFKYTFGSDGVINSGSPASIKIVNNLLDSMVEVNNNARKELIFLLQFNKGILKKMQVVNPFSRNNYDLEDNSRDTFQVSFASGQLSSIQFYNHKQVNRLQYPLVGFLQKDYIKTLPKKQKSVILNTSVKEGMETRNYIHNTDSCRKYFLTTTDSSENFLEFGLYSEINLGGGLSQCAFEHQIFMLSFNKGNHLKTLIINPPGPFEIMGDDIYGTDNEVILEIGPSGMYKPH